MQHRSLGRTGLDVSPLTLHTRGLDARTSPDLDAEEAAAALTLALDRGVNALVTSPGYGEAQDLVGAVLRREGRAGHVQVFAHVPPLVPQDLPSPHLHADHVFPGRHIRERAEASLKALGVERLALLVLPDWQMEWTNEGDWRGTCAALKAEGKIAGFAVAPFDHDPGAAVDVTRGGKVDVVEAMYNPFDPEAAADLFPAAMERGVGVIARSPLYGGAIAPGWGEAAFPPGDWRAEFFYAEHLAETRERAAALAEHAAPGGTVSELALRFCLSHPGVTTVSVGMRSRAHVEANLDAALAGPLPPSVLQALTAYKWLC